MGGLAGRQVNPLGVGAARLAGPDDLGDGVLVNLVEARLGDGGGGVASDRGRSAGWAILKPFRHVVRRQPYGD